MEIILIKDVDNLGARNEVVKVKNGYARNYYCRVNWLLRTVPATESNWKKE